MIYFIRSGDAVKVGHTKRGIRSRMAELQTGNPVKLELLCEVPGDCPDERAIHRLLSKHRLNGEWFKLVPVLTYLMTVAIDCIHPTLGLTKPHEAKAIDLLREHPEMSESVIKHLYEVMLRNHDSDTS